MGVAACSNDFLKKADNPKFTGEIVFQRRAPHCWGPRVAELFGKMVKQIEKVAPAGADLKSWKVLTVSGAAKRRLHKARERDVEHARRTAAAVPLHENRALVDALDDATFRTGLAIRHEEADRSLHAQEA